MAIHPIDLQTMYSQMNNVARSVANAQQGAQLSQQLQEGAVIRQNLEKAQMVKKAANDESKSGTVNEDGHRHSDMQGQGEKKQDAEEPESYQNNEIRESYLGQHIDITR
ncbi:MAG: hypothetical protein K6G80_05750 [Treponema sp.]|nr:hypothetical protein [Treponema sp.]